MSSVWQPDSLYDSLTDVWQPDSLYDSLTACITAWQLVWQPDSLYDSLTACTTAWQLVWQPDSLFTDSQTVVSWEICLVYDSLTACLQTLKRSSRGKLRSPVGDVWRAHYFWDAAALALLAACHYYCTHLGCIGLFGKHPIEMHLPKLALKIRSFASWIQTQTIYLIDVRWAWKLSVSYVENYLPCILGATQPWLVATIMPV